MRYLLIFILLLTSTQLLAEAKSKRPTRKLMVFKLMLDKNKRAKRFIEKYRKTAIWHQKAKDMESSSRENGNVKAARFWKRVSAKRQSYLRKLAIHWKIYFQEKFKMDIKTAYKWSGLIKLPGIASEPTTKERLTVKIDQLRSLEGSFGVSARVQQEISQAFKDIRPVSTREKRPGLMLNGHTNQPPATATTSGF